VILSPEERRAKRGIRNSTAKLIFSQNGNWDRSVGGRFVALPCRVASHDWNGLGIFERKEVSESIKKSLIWRDEYIAITQKPRSFDVVLGDIKRYLLSGDWKC
jgi:hypothetical protein